MSFCIKTEMPKLPKRHKNTIIAPRGKKGGWEQFSVYAHHVNVEQVLTNKTTNKKGTKKHTNTKAIIKADRAVCGIAPQNVFIYRFWYLEVLLGIRIFDYCSLYIPKRYNKISYVALVSHCFRFNQKFNENIFAIRQGYM